MAGSLFVVRRSSFVVVDFLFGVFSVFCVFRGPLLLFVLLGVFSCSSS
jgi:hypothetical protein